MYNYSRTHSTSTTLKPPPDRAGPYRSPAARVIPIISTTPPPNNKHASDMRHRASSSIADTARLHSGSVSPPSPTAAPGELEMDFESSPAPPRSRSRMSGKSTSPARKVARKEFIAGIGLLMCVVFLWTGSNFVTQVRCCAMDGICYVLRWRVGLVRWRL